MNSAVLGYPAAFPLIRLPRATSDWRIGVAVAASMLIHGFALGWLPGLEGRRHEQAPPLKVRLAVPAPQPQILAVPPTPTFLPASAQAVRPAPGLTPPRPAALLASPSPQAQPEFVLPRSIDPPTAAPIDVPRPVPTAVAERPTVVDPARLAAYGRELAGALAAHQRYPRIALLRQWQGTTLLQLELAADGRLLGVRVLSSSGHDTLDRQALDMVREAVPLPAMPAALAGRALTVDVPVVFRITS